eukprot:10202836-Alexandrium_andersonii.AAC.1
MGRARALPAYIGYTPHTQFGSLPSRSTEQAAHTIRGFLRLAEKKRLSAAVLFIDVSSAFYVVLRPL